MKRITIAFVTAAFAIGAAACGADNATASETAAKTENINTMDGKNDAAQQQSFYDFTMKSIDGKDVKLSDFKGKKILVVNVASECGNTPQYAKLETLYKEYKDKLVILGFPANNFGGQEPGSDKEISSFCTKNYGVTFPMFSKISVKGSDKAPLYQWLSDKSKNGVTGEEPDWNFAKYVIDENGKMLAFFPAKTDPMDEKILALINQ